MILIFGNSEKENFYMTIIQIRNKGNITLPVNLRRKYKFKEGDIFTIIDLGDGTLVLAPQQTQLDRSGDRIAEMMAETGISVDDLLKALDEERDRYYQEQYAQSKPVPG
jgi:bifunctional DNA-binding transcriptional regulator/antitoxin component of YhaV-PrlF toxin-antitoxin module